MKQAVTVDAAYKYKQSQIRFVKAEALLPCFLSVFVPVTIDDLYQAGARTHREVDFSFEFDALEGGTVVR